MIDAVHGSFFTGLGAFDLASIWMDWINSFQCEINPYAIRVLEKRFPEAKRYLNINDTDFSIYNGLVDIITGGFPCQPFSTAGNQLGSEDPRYLWPAMYRGILQIQPSYVVAENVRGLVSWNEGLVFETVCADLEAAGYQIIPAILPAASVNAPHRRERIWFIAHSPIIRRKRNVFARQGIQWYEQARREVRTGNSTLSTSVPLFTDTYTNVNSGSKGGGNQNGSGTSGRYTSELYAQPSGNWQNFPSEPGICRTDDGIAHRVDRLKLLGNAIVPQVAYNIFQVIQQIDQQLYGSIQSSIF